MPAIPCGGQPHHPGRDRLCAEILVAAEGADPDGLAAASALAHVVAAWLGAHRGSDDQAGLRDAGRHFGDDAVFACLFTDCIAQVRSDSWAAYGRHARDRLHRVDQVLAGFRRLGIDTLPGAERCRAALAAVRADPEGAGLATLPPIPGRLCAAFEVWVRQRFVDDADHGGQRMRLTPADGRRLAELAADLRSCLGREPTVAEFAARLGCPADDALQRTLSDLGAGTLVGISPPRRRTRPQPAARAARAARLSTRRR